MNTNNFLSNKSASCTTNHTTQIMRAILHLGIILSLIPWLLVHPVQAADLEANVDRTRIVEGDSLTLTLVASGDSQGTPDLEVLSPDFDIISQSQSSRISIINGTSNSTQEWRIAIMPKRTGNLTVPAIHLDGLSSEPITIEVLTADKAGQIGKTRPVLIEVATDSNAPYVQGQVIYTVRILSRVPMQQASLTEPTAPEAIIERLGQDTGYKTQRDGQSYDVTERRYAIFPQHSGLLTIESPVLSAITPEPGGRHLLIRDPFFNIPFGDPFGDRSLPFTHPIKVRGNALTLEVKPQAARTTGPWLPAKALKFTESWSPAPPVFRVGDPVTRSLTVTATGLSAAQIPDLEFTTPAGIKLYPDKPQSENQTRDDAVVATKIFKHALVPTKAGSFTLPEIRLAWWNTQTNLQQVITIPERTVEILPAPGDAPAETPAPTTTTPAPARGTVATKTTDTAATPKPQPNSSAAASPAAPPQPATTNTISYWVWLASGLGLAWLATLGLWLWDRRYGGIRKPKHAAATAAISIGKAKAQIERSCRANDAKATRAALLAWGAVCWPTEPPKRLDALAARLAPEAAQILVALDQHLYAPSHLTSSPNATTPTWDGIAAWHILAPALTAEAKTATNTTNQLPPLYPG